MSRRKNFRQSNWPIEFSPRKNVDQRIVGIRSTFRGSTFFRLEEILPNMFNPCTVGQITIFLDINRIRHKMVKNAIKVGNIRRKTSLGQNFFA